MSKLALCHYYPLLVISEMSAIEYDQSLVMSQVDSDTNVIHSDICTTHMQYAIVRLLLPAYDMPVSCMPALCMTWQAF